MIVFALMPSYMFKFLSAFSIAGMKLIMVGTTTAA